MGHPSSSWCYLLFAVAGWDVPVQARRGAVGPIHHPPTTPRHTPVPPHRTGKRPPSQFHATRTTVYNTQRNNLALWVALFGPPNRRRRRRHPSRFVASRCRPSPLPPPSPPPLICRHDNQACLSRISRVTVVSGQAVRGGGGGALALVEGGGWATLVVPGVIYYSPLQAGMYRSRRDVVRSVQSTIPRPRPGTPRCPPIAQGNARPPNSTPHTPPYTKHKGTT